MKKKQAITLASFILFACGSPNLNTGALKQTETVLFPANPSDACSFSKPDASYGGICRRGFKVESARPVQTGTYSVTGHTSWRLMCSAGLLSGSYYGSSIYRTTDCRVDNPVSTADKALAFVKGLRGCSDSHFSPGGSSCTKTEVCTTQWSVTCVPLPPTTK